MIIENKEARKKGKGKITKHDSSIHEKQKTCI